MIASYTSKLGRKPHQRKQLLRNLATSLLLYESIHTTRSRAKAVQRLIERMIARSKVNPPHVAVRFLNTIVTDKNASRKMMEVLVQRFQKRSSGFSRIKLLGRRVGDGAELVEISLMDEKL